MDKKKKEEKDGDSRKDIEVTLTWTSIDRMHDKIRIWKE